MDNPLLPKRSANESVERMALAPRSVSRGPAKDNDPRSTPRSIWPSSSIGRASLSSAGKICSSRIDRFPFRAGATRVFAVIDTASKTGTDNDATTVTFFAYDTIGKIRLPILDSNIVQIEGAVLDLRLPEVFQTLEELARLCRARRGSLGVFLEDKNSGQSSCSRRCGGKCLRARLSRKLTAMGKDSERAISVSGYVHRGWSSTRTEPSKGLSSTNATAEITCWTKSRRLAAAPRQRGRTHLLAVRYASRSLSGIARAFSTTCANSLE